MIKIGGPKLQLNLHYLLNEFKNRDRSSTRLNKIEGHNFPREPLLIQNLSKL